MPRTATGWALIAILISSGAAKAQDVRWRPDYNAARKEAAATGTPLLLDFGSEGCTWCRKMDATTFTNTAVITDLQKAITVRVDGDEAEVRDGHRGSELANKYGVKMFPTHVMVDGDGRVIARAPGYMEPQQFLSWFKQSLAKAYQQSALQPSGS